MSDKEIIDKLIDLTDGNIDHFDREDAMDMLYEVKRLINKREESSFCKKVLEKIKAEMQDIMIVSQDEERIYQEINAIIDKHIAESEDV